MEDEFQIDLSHFRNYILNVKANIKYISVIVLIALYLTASERKTISLSFGGYDHPMSYIAEKILREAYGKIGIDIIIQEFPPERYQALANIGSFDGILFGGARIGDKFTDLVKVQVPLGYDDIVVFTKNKNAMIDGWDSLKPYRIGIMIGMPEIEKRTDGMSVSKVATPRQLFLMLNAERIDFVVLPRTLGLMAIKKLNLKTIRLVPVTLERWGMYHYLNKKNLKLVLIIEKVLTEMQLSGRIRSINQQIESDLLK